MNKKNKGISYDSLIEALDKVESTSKDPNFERCTTANDYYKTQGSKNTPKDPGTSDPSDPFAHIIKPTSKVWEKPILTAEDEAIYYGLHIHSSTNPFGLHSHFPGGTLTGAHTHGPVNKYGVHTHKETVDPYGPTMLDGKHVHKLGANAPCGKHVHEIPENFA